MAENTKYMVPVTKYGKWTGDNLAELEAFWADELTARSASLSADPVTGNLVGSNEFFGGFGTITCPVGWWITPGGLSEELPAGYAEIPDAGLIPE